MCNKIGITFGSLVFLTALISACGPTPPSPLSYPTSSAGTSSGGSTGTSTGSSDGTTTGAGTTTGNTQPTDPTVPPTDPNTGNPNGTPGNPNVGNANVNVAFFATSAGDTNKLIVVLSSDANFCTNLSATPSTVEKSSTDIELQMDAPVVGIAADANVTTVTKCKAASAQDGNVTLSAYDGATTCAGSFTTVTKGRQETGSFTAAPCPALQSVLPFSQELPLLVCAPN